MTAKIIELAKSISPQTVESCRYRSPLERILENERKYGGEDGRRTAEQPSDISQTISETYREINSGFDNGRCATRAGTYRKFKRLQTTN